MLHFSRKPFAMALLLSLNSVAWAASETPDTTAVVKPVDAVLQDRQVELLSYDGSVQLLNTPGNNAPQSSGVVTLANTLRTLLPLHEQWVLRGAEQLAIRAQGKESKLGLPAGSYYVPSTARLSDDGTVLALAAGHNGQLHAMRWQTTKGLQPLIPAGKAHISGVSDMSNDGRTIIGWYQASPSDLTRGFMWTEAGGFTPLPAMLNEPVFTSGDGNVVLGEHYRATLKSLQQNQQAQAFMNSMPFDGQDEFGYYEVVAVSHDGQRIAGYVAHTTEPVWQPFLWVADNGFVDLDSAGLLEKPQNGAEPDFAAFRQRIIKAAGMSAREAFTPLSTQAVLWQVGKGVELLEGMESSAGLSRDGKQAFAYSALKPGQSFEMPQLWRFNAKGRKNLHDVIAEPDVYLPIYGMSEDGSRIWLSVNGDTESRTVLLVDAALHEMPSEPEELVLGGTSRDAATSALFVQDLEQGYPVMILRDNQLSAAGDQCRAGDAALLTEYLKISANGKVIAVNKENSTCLQTLQP